MTDIDEIERTEGNLNKIPFPWAKKLKEGKRLTKYDWRAACLWSNQLISNIQDALGTAETGEALVEVARNAHRAEQQLAQIERNRHIEQTVRETK